MICLCYFHITKISLILFKNKMKAYLVMVYFPFNKLLFSICHVCMPCFLYIMSILICKNYVHISLQYDQSSPWMKLKQHQTRNLFWVKRKPLIPSRPKFHKPYGKCSLGWFLRRTLGNLSKSLLPTCAVGSSGRVMRILAVFWYKRLVTPKCLRDTWRAKTSLVVHIKEVKL